jgi:hypothetical protein
MQGVLIGHPDIVVTLNNMATGGICQVTTIKWCLHEVRDPHTSQFLRCWQDREGGRIQRYKDVWPNCTYMVCGGGRCGIHSLTL